MINRSKNTKQLTEHFFRHSYGKTVAVLVRYFGLDQVEIAEDIVQDTLVEAMEKWSIHNIPDNPEAWIMDVAKKKTINFLKRNQTFEKKIAPRLDNSYSYHDGVTTDSTIRLIFACCHPSLPVESQISLALKTLCGLSIPEIARALLTNEDNINKRLYRAKTKFRKNEIQYVIPTKTQWNERLDGVCHTLYLLFNEGYYAPHHDDILRIDLCYEALRLLKEVDSAVENSSKVNGLLSLMLFSLARFESRLDENDSLICLQDQNRESWDQELIAEGMKYLTIAIQSKEAYSYQLQAGIAAEHCLAADFNSTNWSSIYQQYLILESLDPTFLVKLNKNISYYFLGHRDEALKALMEMEKSPDFMTNVSYYLTIGTLNLNSGHNKKASNYLKKALSLTESKKEHEIIQRRLDSIPSI